MCPEENRGKCLVTHGCSAANAEVRESSGFFNRTYMVPRWSRHRIDHDVTVDRHPRPSGKLGVRAATFLKNRDPMRVWPGQPYPLGATWTGLGVNFAIFSAHATQVELCLFDARDGLSPSTS